MNSNRYTCLTIFTLVLILLVLHANAQTYFNKGKLFSDTAVFGSAKIADFNNDNHQDIIAAVRRNPLSDSIGFFDLLIYQNNNDSTFKKVDTISLAYKDLYFTIGDITRDNNIDIIVSGIDTLGGTHLHVFKNKKNFNFIDTLSFATIKKPGQILLDDFNNDGTKDIFINASLQSDTTCTIFIDSLQHFIPKKSRIPTTDHGEALNFDYDGNGWPDILITGFSNEQVITKLYINRLFHFKRVKDSSITAVHHSKIAVSDYNNDGEPDIALGGITAKGDTLTTVYLKYGKRFIPFKYIHTRVLPMEIVFADLNHDGNSDLLLTGWKGSLLQTKLFINRIGVSPVLNGTEIDNIPKPHLASLSDSFRFIANGDLNADGNMDLFTGKEVYFNVSLANKRPVLVMKNTKVITFNSNTVFIWEQATDDVTPANSITYEFYLKEANGNYLFPSELNDSAKYRKISHVGRVGRLAYAVVKGLTNGMTYSWAVVPIDNSLHGGITIYPTVSGTDGVIQITDCLLPVKDTVLCGKGIYTFYGKKDTETLWFSMNKGLLGREDTASYEVDEDDISDADNGIDYTPDNVFSINLVNVCDQSYAMQIRIMDRKEHYLSPSDTIICSSGVVEIDALYNPSNMKWFVDGEALSFTGTHLELNIIKQITDVGIEGLDSDRCAYSDKMQIRLTDKKGHYLFPLDTIICSNGDIGIDALYNPSNVKWFVNGEALSFAGTHLQLNSVAQTTEVSIEGFDAGKCPYSDKMQISIKNKKEHYLSPSDTIICSSGDIAIDALYNPSNVKWLVNGEALPFKGTHLELNSVKQTTDVSIEGLDSGRCAYSDRMQIRIMDKKEHYLFPSDTIICSQGGITIDALYNPSNVKWFVNGEMLSITGTHLELNAVRDSTEVRVTGLDSGRCAYSDTMQIRLFPFSEFIETTEITIEQYSDTILTASGGSNYNWTSTYSIINPSSASITVEPMDTTKFYVTANDSNNCVRTDTVTVNVTPFDYSKRLFIPALFTPNEDGQNDFFKVYGSGITALQFSVKDRVGNTVFSATNHTETWDGTVNGVPQPSGLYYWTLSGKYENGQEIKINHANAGAVRLVR